VTERYTLHDLQRAIAAGKQGRADEALRICAQIVAADPGYAPAWHLRGSLELERGDAAAAQHAIGHALALDPRLPMAHYHLGLACAALNLLPEARDAFREAARIHPDSPQAFTAVADLELKLANPGAALVALADARRLGGTGPALARLEAQAAAQLGRLDEALVALEALATAGDLPSWELRAGLLAGAGRDLALDAVLAHAPKLASLDLHRARRARQRGALAEARALLEPLVAGADLATALRARFELGAVEEAAGAHAAAWAHWRDGNAAVAALEPPPHPERPRFGEWLALVGERLDLAALAAAPRAAAPAPAPAFLFGFPRSGTTLLDAMLDAHGAFRIAEESGAANHVLDALEARGRRYPEGLTGLDAAGIAALREAYAAAIAGLLGADAPLERIVDKNPLLTPYLPALWLAFPAARFVFVQRHPLDVVRSCYAFGFQPGRPLAAHADVAALARDYLATYELWERVSAALPLRAHTVRYERLVAEPEPTLRALLAFLGAEWRPSVLVFDAHARARQHVTNNAETIVQPLFATSVGRWQRNAAELEPARAVLAPLLERLGYA